MKEYTNRKVSSVACMYVWYLCSQVACFTRSSDFQCQVLQCRRSSWACFVKFQLDACWWMNIEQSISVSRPKENTTPHTPFQQQWFTYHYFEAPWTISVSRSRFGKTRVVVFSICNASAATPTPTLLRCVYTPWATDAYMCYMQMYVGRVVDPASVHVWLLSL